jgi:hypothetical protein
MPLIRPRAQAVIEEASRQALRDLSSETLGGSGFIPEGLPESPER